MKPTVAIVGCGRVGTNLARYLHDAGYPLAGLASRSVSSAKRAAELSGGSRFGSVDADVCASADVVFITTPDDVIAEVCDQMVRKNALGPHAVVLHCSGSQPSSILKAGRRPTGSLHPLQSIAAAELESSPFRGAMMAVEGTPEAVSLIEAIAVDLGGNPFRIKTEAKMLYHAAAVVASNYLVTLMDISISLLEHAGIDPKLAFTVIQPLVSGTLKNISGRGTAAALTGPVARGDVGTIRHHLDTLDQMAAMWLPIYKAMGCATVDLARRGGFISGQVAAELKGLLG